MKTWRPKQPGYQQPQYWCCYSGYWPQRQRGKYIGAFNMLQKTFSDAKIGKQFHRNICRLHQSAMSQQWFVSMTIYVEINEICCQCNRLITREYVKLISNIKFIKICTLRLLTSIPWIDNKGSIAIQEERVSARDNPPKMDGVSLARLIFHLLALANKG